MIKFFITILLFAFNYCILQSMDKDCTEEMLLNRYFIDINDMKSTAIHHNVRFSVENDDIIEKTNCARTSNLEIFLLYPLGQSQQRYCRVSRCDDEKQGCPHQVVPTHEPFDILKDNIIFKKFSLPVLTSLKIFQKNTRIRIPRPLQNLILEKSFKKPHYFYLISEVDYYINKFKNKFFPSFKISQMFINNHIALFSEDKPIKWPDGVNFIIVFSNNKQNIVYVDPRPAYLCPNLIIPCSVGHKEDRVVVDSTLGSMDVCDMKRFDMLQYCHNHRYQLFITKHDNTQHSVILKK